MWIILIGFPNTNVNSNSPATIIADLPQVDV